MRDVLAETLEIRKLVSDSNSMSSVDVACVSGYTPRDRWGYLTEGCKQSSDGMQGQRTMALPDSVSKLSHSERTGLMLSRRFHSMATAIGDVVLQTTAKDASVCRPSSRSAARGFVRHRKMHRSSSSHAHTAKQLDDLLNSKQNGVGP